MEVNQNNQIDRINEILETSEPKEAFSSIDTNHPTLVNNTDILGSRLLRYAASSLDGILTSLVGVAILMPISFLLNMPSGKNENSTLFNLLSLAISLSYAILFIKFKNATPGKSFFGLKVIHENKKELSWSSIILRETVGKFLSAAVFMIGFLWILLDKNRQGWHDKIAGTLVIQEKEVAGWKKFIAYLFVVVLPILAILGILAVITLVAIDPIGRLQDAKQAEQEPLKVQQRAQDEFNQFAVPEETPMFDTNY